MADNFSTHIAESLLRHDVDLAKLDAGNARQIKAMFRTLGQDVAEQVSKIDPTSSQAVAVRNKKLRQVIAAGNTTIEEGYEKIQDVTLGQGADLAKVEAAAVAGAANGAINVDMISGRLNANVLKRLADKTLIFGAPSRDWWKEQKTLSQGAFRKQMREGVLQGESIQDLVRRIRGRREHGFKDGLMAYNSSASRRAAALARSSVMAVANAARFETYQQNSDVIKGVSWLSTLDKKTTDICKALDGQAWTLDGKRLPGTVHKWRGPPPAHWNCRSTLTPVLRSWSDLITDKKVKGKLLNAEAKGKLAPGWRAAMDGKVSADMNYEDWLKKQTKAVQVEALGAKKRKLWLAGKLKFRDLIDQSHQPFTLKELADRVKPSGVKQIQSIQKPLAETVINSKWTKLVDEEHTRQLVMTNKERGDLDKQLKKILKDAPITVNAPMDVISKILKDGRIKSQFETNKSSGVLSHSLRGEFESKIFNYPANLDPKKRPIYGSWGRGKLTNLTSQYGEVTIKLKPKVRSRTTITFSDSLDATGSGTTHSARPSPIDNPSWQSIDTTKFNSHLQTARKTNSLESLNGWVRNYAESQIHGGVSIDDIEEIIFITPPQEELVNLLNEKGIKWILE